MEPSTLHDAVASSGIASTSRAIKALAALLTLFGIAALVWLTAEAGPAALLDSLTRVSTVLPHVLLLEAARMLAELWSMHALLGKHVASVSAARLLRAQLLCSALSIVMPAGRVIGESARAAALTGAVPTPVAVATSALGQVLTLLVNGSVGLLGALVAWQLGANGFAGVCTAYGVALLAAGVTLFAAMAGLLQRSRLTAHLAESFVRAGRALRVGSAGLGRAALAHALTRVLQTAQLGLLALALGHPRAWADAPMLEVIYLLGAAAGDWVPEQLGTVDAAFAFARPLLEMKAPATLALGLALHALQLTAAGLWFVGLLMLTGRRAATSARARSARPPTELA